MMFLFSTLPLPYSAHRMLSITADFPEPLRPETNNFSISLKARNVSLWERKSVIFRLLIIIIFFSYIFLWEFLVPFLYSIQTLTYIPEPCRKILAHLTIVVVSVFFPYVQLSY